VTNSLPKPTFNPPAGNYLGAQSVTLSGPAGSTIHYTTDGSDPLTSPTKIAAPAPVIGVVVPVDSDGFTLKAYSALSGFAASGITTAVYNTLSTPTWSLNGSGDWSEAANWRYGIIADGAGITADLGKLTLIGNTTSTLDVSGTIGNVIFGDLGNAFGWTVTGSSPITLNNLGSVPSITVQQQTANLMIPLAGSSGLAKNGPGTLILSGLNTYTGATTVNEGTLVQLCNPLGYGFGTECDHRDAGSSGHGLQRRRNPPQNGSGQLRGGAGCRQLCHGVGRDDRHPGWHLDRRLLCQ
jgi:autotransporter-associated beta strand protein